MDTQDQLISGDDKNKKRKRNKQLLKSIRQQVEFYFSDANLRKDRFLKQEISGTEDRYVDVSVIASFNRMKVLCPDPGLIPQALSTSELLELNDDKTRIRRKTPLGEPEYDPDDVTVYVECLPKSVDHDWLRKVFGVCGSVEYVSLPRYRSTGDPKGFAFIEFKTPEEADKACEMLNNPPEEETSKLGHFPKTKGRRYVPVDDEEDDDKSKDEKRSKLEHGDESQTSSKKRSHDDDDDDKGHKRHRRTHQESESSDGKPERQKRKRQHSDDGDANSYSRNRRRDSGDKKQESNVEDGKELESKKRKNLEGSDYHTKDTKDDHHRYEQDKMKKQHREDESNKGDHDDGSQSKKNRQTEKEKKTDKPLADEQQKKSEKRKHDDTKKENSPDKDIKKSKHMEDEKTIQSNQVEDKETQSKALTNEEDSKSRKRKHLKSEGESEETSNKKNKIRDSMESDRSKEHLGGKRSISREDEEEEEDNEEDDKKESDSDEKGKKKRARKKKPEKKKETKENDLQLRVISKKEWLDLKHRYLSLQKASIAKIKQAFRRGGDFNKQGAYDMMETKAVKSTEPEFTPGVVLKIEMKKAMETRQQVKDDLQTVAPVAYIDLQPGDHSGYVRCKSTEGAAQILNKYGPNETDNNITVNLLSGEDEKQYWEKLRADRSNKLSSKQKKKKKRGVDRLLCKAEKVLHVGMDKSSHLRFDDD